MSRHQVHFYECDNCAKRVEIEDGQWPVGGRWWRLQLGLRQPGEQPRALDGCSPECVHALVGAVLGDDAS